MSFRQMYGCWPEHVLTASFMIRILNSVILYVVLKGLDTKAISCSTHNKKTNFIIEKSSKNVCDSSRFSNMRIWCSFLIYIIVHWMSFWPPLHVALRCVLGESSILLCFRLSSPVSKSNQTSIQVFWWFVLLLFFGPMQTEGKRRRRSWAEQSNLNWITQIWTLECFVVRAHSPQTVTQYICFP